MLVWKSRCQLHYYHTPFHSKQVEGLSLNLFPHFRMPEMLTVGVKLWWNIYLLLSVQFYRLSIKIWAVTWNFQQCGMCDQQRLRPAVWSDPFLVAWIFFDCSIWGSNFKGSCTGSSESTLVKMPHCWKSHVAAHFILALWPEPSLLSHMK